MNMCQCEGCQMGQSSGVLLKEVAVFQRCLMMEVSLYTAGLASRVNYPTLCTAVCTDTCTELMAPLHFNFCVVLYSRYSRIGSHPQKFRPAKIQIGLLCNGKTWPSANIKTQKLLKAKIHEIYTPRKLKRIQYNIKDGILSRSHYF